MLRSEVSNQPAGTTQSRTAGTPVAPTESTDSGSVGVRAIVQIGYRIVDPLVLSVRASYQGRTINHAGPGGGGGLEYRW